MNTLKTNDSFHRLAALSGVVGPIFFILVVIVLGMLYNGYSHLSQAISELGAVDSPVRFWQTINFLLLGVSLILFALSFHQRFPGSSKLATLLLLYFAIFAAIGNGVFSCAPGCEMVTTTGILHNMTGLTGFIALSIAMFLIARSMRKVESWSRWSTYTKVSGLLAIVFLILWLITGPAGGVAPNIHGVFQRLMAISFLQWFVVMGVLLLNRVEDRPFVKSAMQY